MALGRRVRLPRGALAKLRRCDEGLARVIKDVGPCRMEVGYAETHLASLIRAIVYQQLSGKAAATIYGRFRALFDEGAFPSAQEIRRIHYTKLRKAGLSRQKQVAVRDLCRHIVEGRLPLDDVEEHDDEVLIERLTAVRGIGRWSGVSINGPSTTSACARAWRSCSGPTSCPSARRWKPGASAVGPIAR